jgi:hypothetical protein
MKLKRYTKLIYILLSQLIMGKESICPLQFIQLLQLKRLTDT